MQTPDDEAGRETELVMQALQPWDTLKRVKTETYNRCYEAVYALLKERLDLELEQAAGKEKG